MISIHFSDLDRQKEIEDVEDQVRKLGVTYPVGHDPENELFRAYGNRTRPDLFFFDAQSRVRHKIVGGSTPEEWQRIFEQLDAEA